MPRSRDTLTKSSVLAYQVNFPVGDLKHLKTRFPITLSDTLPSVSVLWILEYAPVITSRRNKFSLDGL